MSNEGKRVRAHYIGTFDDGTVFDSSVERGEPLEFVCMAGQMIPGFDKAVNTMEVGETKEVTKEKVTFDLNHEMAGKDLNFEITLVEVVE